MAIAIRTRHWSMTRRHRCIPASASTNWRRAARCRRTSTRMRKVSTCCPGQAILRVHDQTYPSARRFRRDQGRDGACVARGRNHAGPMAPDGGAAAEAARARSRHLLSSRTRIRARTMQRLLGSRTPQRRAARPLRRRPDTARRRRTDVGGGLKGVFLKWLIDEKFGAAHHRLLFIEYLPGVAIGLHDHTYEEAYFILAVKSKPRWTGSVTSRKPATSSGRASAACMPSPTRAANRSAGSRRFRHNLRRRTCSGSWPSGSNARENWRVPHHDRTSHAPVHRRRVHSRAFATDGKSGFTASG